jgi:SAM-dependent methyltransferase
MVAARSGDEAVVLGADVAGLAAELARVTGLNGRTVVVDASERARANVERASAKAGSLVEFEAMHDGRWPLADAVADVVVISPASCAAGIDPAPAFREAMRVLRGGGRLAALAPQQQSPWASMFRRGLPAAVDPGAIVTAVEKAGFRGARVLGAADGVAYIEAIKPR